jgi:hypothetical protein
MIPARRLSAHSPRQLRQSDSDASFSNVDPPDVGRHIVIDLPLFAAVRTSGREIAGTFVGTSSNVYRGTSLHSRHF